MTGPVEYSGGDIGNGRRVREPIWDLAKGVAILSVIAIHSFQTSSLQGWEVDFVLIGRQLFDFAVPMFLALSGYFHGRGQRFDTKARLLRVLIPYVIWTTIYIALLKPNHFIHPKALLLDYAAGDGIAIGYFIIVLCQFILLAPLMRAITSARVHVAIMAAGALIGLTLTYATAKIWEFPYSALLFVVWYPYYHLGLFIARFPQYAPSRSSSVLWAGPAAVALGCAITEAYTLHSYDMGLAISQIRLSVMAMSIALFMLTISLRSARLDRGKFLVWIGANSFFIYLFHLLPMMIAKKALRHFHIDNVAIQFIACFLTAAIQSLVALAIARRMAPSRFQPFLLG